MRLTVIPNSLQLLNRSSPASRHPLRRRLWKGGIAAAAILAVFICFDVSARLKDPSPKLSLGHDLLPSYAAGVVVREGRPRDMYDRQALSAVEFRIIREANLEIDGRYGPWLNPPFFAWVFTPLVSLPYRSAAAIFLIINLALFAIALTLLTRLLLTAQPSSHSHPVPSPPYSGDRVRVRGRSTSSAISSQYPDIDWRTLGLVPLLVLVPLPFWQAMGHQQNTFISLTLLLIAVTCWRQGKIFTAGVVTGLLFFKPQLAAVFAAVLVLGTGWRALVGIALTGTALLLITLLTLPGCLGDFLHRLPPILHWLQMESPFNWGRQVTFQSFWRLLIQGQVRGETSTMAKTLWWLCSAGFLAMMIAAIVHYRRGPRAAAARDRLIAAALASMPALMPYYMDYDLLLLAIPAVLLASDWIQHPKSITRADYLLLAAWIVFGLESHFNPGLASHSRLNLAVPILAMIGFLHLRRCLPRRDVVPT